MYINVCATEIKMLRWVCGAIRKDMKGNIFIHNPLGIVSVENRRIVYIGMDMC